MTLRWDPRQLLLNNCARCWRLIRNLRPIFQRAHALNVFTSEGAVVNRVFYYLPSLVWMVPLFLIRILLKLIRSNCADCLIFTVGVKEIWTFAMLVWRTGPHQFLHVFKSLLILLHNHRGHCPHFLGSLKLSFVLWLLVSLRLPSILLGHLFVCASWKRRMLVDFDCFFAVSVWSGSGPLSLVLIA